MHSLVVVNQSCIHLFICVSLVDLRFTLVANAAYFYLIPLQNCEIICHSSTTSHNSYIAFTHIINLRCFSIITFVLLRFSFWSHGHVGAVLFSKMSKVRSETVSTEKWKVYLAQNHSYCGLHFVLLNLIKIQHFVPLGLIFDI